MSRDRRGQGAKGILIGPQASRMHAHSVVNRFLVSSPVERVFGIFMQACIVQNFDLHGMLM